MPKNQTKQQVVIATKKQIIITEENELLSFDTNGFSHYEVLGLLRLFEQKMSLRLLKGFSDLTEQNEIVKP